MRRRVLTWLVASVLIVAGVLLWWRSSDRPTVANNNSSEVAAIAPAAPRPPRVATTNESTVSESTAPALLAVKNTDTAAAAKTNHLAYRLTNTSKSVKQMLRDDRAIHLENALIDTSRPLGFKLPEQLRIVGDPGSYIIQSRGPVDAAFRAALADAGATLISYLPNNAWLVRASADVAQKLAANPETQAVLPWEPVYKLKAELLELAMQQEALPPDAKLNLLVYSGERATVIAQLQKLEAVTVAETTSPFGSVITVRPGTDWVALARLPGVQIMERAYPRALANDLSRVRIGVATNTVTTTNYLGLTGTNILISLNDFGVDVNHPDFAGNRLFGTSAAALVDTDGHGTHVAGILIGSGVASTNVTNARGSLNPGTNGQYRGVASGAKLFVQRIYEGLNSTPDETLQQNIARTNALISNNSWSYSGDSSYSLAAASYDAAVRDSLPGVTGSQPVLYVFAAGNGGGGSDAGLSGNPGSVLSPGTAKNVVTVGAIELERDITNVVEKIVGSSTNKTTPWKAMTSSGNQVARFSSRGNVGIGIEGDFGRFKPDVMAPGTFVISTRSTTWDEVAYYNPTNHSYTRLRNQLVATNGSLKRSIFLPDNAVGFSITLLGNDDSPIPFPNLPIYVRRNGQASSSTYDLRRTNSVSVPPDLGGVGTFVGQNWSYSIGNPTGAAVSFDIFTDVITTNDLGNYYQVLSNLNNSISSTNLTTPNFYRYESGTSMAAPAVAGTLALMQEFFEQRLFVTNSPALMKALLINGARSVGNLYDFQVQNSVNFQGWGLIKLNNSLPPGISNSISHTGPTSIHIYDQASTNALATGQSVTRFFTVDDAGRTLPLRVTLAWTDPPGNPAAGVKLVNDLDLVVTNIDTGDIYYGNDIPGSSTLTFPWDTNAAPNLDSVNNVENIFLSPVLGTNYSITVLARRVNVNAVTAHTNDVVQDYALVISCGSGEATNALTVGPQATFTATERTPIAYVTNTFSVPNDFSATFLQNQHVGANSPLLGTTNGVTNQWKFYVVTNTTSFTNAAFLISQQTDLATPRLGVFATSPGESTRRYADLDLYVSKDAGLTNLDPAVVAASFKSLSRNDLSGDELILFTNSVLNDVYYVGVKSEDQQAAEYEFFSIFSLLPLGSEDANGFVRAYPMSGYLIPDGSPSQPGGTRFFAVTRPAIGGGLETIRRVVVTNNVGHENYGDVISTVDHNSRAVVLDNHRSLETPPYLAPPGPYSFLYDDSGEGDFLNAIPPDGPGTFETFIGEAPGGTWYFTYSDDALSQAGGVTNVMIRLDRQPDDDRIITNTVAVNSWRYFSRNVPVEATNLTVIISNLTASTPGPLELYIRKGARPTRTVYDYSKTINPPGGSLSVDKSNIPPLTGGRYFIGIYNGNATAQTFTYQTIVLLGAAPTPTLINGVGSQPLLDDAGTNYSITVTNTGIIGQLDVGLRIDHPRVSDLAVTLISPRGTRVLLVENRGGTNASGFGGSLTVTNFIPVAANGGPATVITNIDTGATVGAVTIDYDFFSVSDQMTVYYQGVLLADTGMTNGSGRLSLNYGPGVSTIIEVRMNEFGNSNTNTLWNFSVSSYNTANNYLIFTDNTNKTTTPIKFAVPPFKASGISSTSILHSSFESDRNQTYATGQFIPDGWKVVLGNVDIIGPPLYSPAAEGNYMLDINGGTAGQVTTNIATIPGKKYLLSYAFDRNPDSRTFCFVVPKAQVLIDSNVIANVVADDPTNTWLTLSWETNKYLFTATSTNTRLDLRADLANQTPCGVLFDAVDLAEILDQARYVLPEESLKAFEGESAFGTWQLEILDTRTGASNNVSLVDWQLQFTFQTAVALPTTLQSGVPKTETIRPGGIIYYIVDVPPWARFATNMLLGATGPLNLYFNQYISPTGTNLVPLDYTLLANVTSGSQTLTTNVPPPVGLPVLLPGQRYYLAVENPSTTTNVTFTLQVEFDLAVFPDFVSLTNGVPYCTFNAGPTVSLDYYRYTVSSNSLRAQFELNNLSGDVTLLLRRGLPPTFGVLDYFSANVFTNDEVITVFNFSQPVSLTPGEWYMAAGNISGGPVSYCAKVTEWPVYGTNIVITNTFLGASSFCLTWTSLPEIHYLVEGITNILSTNWVTVSPTITATGYTTTHCVPLPTPFQFFRVREGVALSTYFPPPKISRIRRVFSGIEITWGGPTNVQYQVQWTPTLVPTNWTAFTNPPAVTSTSGVFQFLDNGSETGGTGGIRFYRLLQLP